MEQNRGKFYTESECVWQFSDISMQSRRFLGGLLVALRERKEDWGVSETTSKQKTHRKSFATPRWLPNDAERVEKE